jgi:hypothetical protein
VAPPESQGSDGNLQHLPWEQRRKPRQTLDEKEKTMRRRMSLFRVFTFNRWCFIYKHVLLGPRATAQPIKRIFTEGVKFCIQQTIISKKKKTKKKEGDYGVTI